MTSIRIDVASEGCQWEVPADDTPCPKPGAGLVGEWLGVYCREHLEIWKQEIERQDERDKARGLGLQDWYRRMAKRQATGNVLIDSRATLLILTAVDTVLWALLLGAGGGVGVGL